MAFTSADIDIIENAIRKLAEGKRVTEIRFSDRTVSYESATMDDLLKLRDRIKSEVSASSPSGRSRVARLYRRKAGF